MGDSKTHGKKKSNLKKKLVWRLPVVMAEKGIYTKTELHRLMTGIGFEISTVHIGRIFKGLPELLNTELLLGLMEVLDCKLTDLIWVEDIKPDGTDDSENDGGSGIKSDDASIGKSRRGPKGGSLKLIAAETKSYDPDSGPHFGARRNLRAERLEEESDKD
jgi:DNA-binding Xre family transcriptional regulator